jgi:CRP/FNR family nitrogen fixation transcriptional regulator
MLVPSEPVGRISAGIQLFGDLGPIRIHTKFPANEFSYKKDKEIYSEKEPADYVYQVVRGTVRGYKLLLHRFTAEAIIDTTVRLVTRRSLDCVALTDARVVRDLLRMTADNLQHAEDHMLLLGRKTAMERVAAFLLEMDRRLTRANMLALPMCRRDIADYLGLTLETVSRAFSQLHDEGILGFMGANQRQIVLQNRQRLLRLGSLGNPRRSLAAITGSD